MAWRRRCGRCARPSRRWRRATTRGGSGPPAATRWASWHRRSTRWPRTWRRSRPCGGRWWRTSPMSCARRSRPCAPSWRTWWTASSTRTPPRCRPPSTRPSGSAGSSPTCWTSPGSRRAPSGWTSPTSSSRTRRRAARCGSPCRKSADPPSEPRYGGRVSEQTLLERPSAEPGVVVVDHLSKSFGPVQAVDDLSFEVGPGKVTGFLGPNGAGKTTTLRMLLGLVTPTAGTAPLGGHRYHDLSRPGHVVGAALEAASFHPGRSARDHLRVYAPQVGVSTRRCDEVLELVGMSDAADRRVGGFSMGMRQRLGLAATLLGDPKVLLLDEPANGLDPEGIAWLRALLRHLAREGRTVLVSSHVLSEVQQTVDDVIIIAKGRLVHASSLADLA